MEDPAHRQEGRPPSHLRLVWSREDATPAERTERPGHLRVLPPCRPANLALVIEGHLSGAYGMSDEDFLQVFSGRAGR